MRPLTPFEIDALPVGLLWAVGVQSVRLSAREHPVSWLRRLIGLKGVIVVRGSYIFWPGLPKDLSEDARGLALLAHELVHVWQYRNGMTLWRYVCRERGRYGYRCAAFDTLGYEQQAAMVEDWVRMRAGLLPRYAREPVDKARLEALIPFT